MELVQVPLTSQLPAGHDGPELATSKLDASPAPETGDVEMPVDLPRPVFDFLFSERYRNSQANLRTISNMTEDQLVLIGDMSRLVMAGAVPLDEALETVADELKGALPDADRERMFAQLLSDRFVPLGDAISPTAAQVAQARNLKMPDAPYYRVYVHPLTFSAAATEIATACGFSLMGRDMRERMRDVVMSKIKGVRVDRQIRDVLTRPQEFGGLGMDQKTADQIIATMNDILGRATVISEDEYADWLSKQSSIEKPVGADLAPARPADAKAITGVAPTADDREDDQEIAAIKSRMPERSGSVLDLAIDEVLGRLSYKPPDEYLGKRIRNIISSRLRDVRTAEDVRALLARDTKVGGLGLAAADAARVATDIESGYADFHDRVAAEEQKKIAEQLEAQKRKITERRRIEAAEHAKWYEERIRSRKVRESEKREAFSAMRSASATALEYKEKQVEQVKYGPLIPAASHDAGRSVVAPISDGRMDRVPAGPFAKPGVKVSPQTMEIAMKKAADRPTLDAMGYAGPKLMGIMGELQSMNVAEFRRLAKDPREAAKKISSLLETLAQESFERKTSGINAFRSSPLQVAYLALVAESLKIGQPVMQIAEEKRKKGENVLSPDEIAAVMQLNSTLQY